MRKGVTLFRCGHAEHRVELTARDVRLLDGQYFLEYPGSHRALFGLDFIGGLGAPPPGKVLRTYERIELHGRLTILLTSLEAQRDLISHDYLYEFEATKGQRKGGGEAGFRINGRHGLIRVHPGFCDLTLSEIGPNGRGRTVQIVDMRAVGRIATDDRGELRVVRRKAETHWFDLLPALIGWVGAQSGETVEILHA
jgi:hypothetical protein